MSNVIKGIVTILSTAWMSIASIGAPPQIYKNQSLLLKPIYCLDLNGVGQLVQWNDCFSYQAFLRSQSVNTPTPIPTNIPKKKTINTPSNKDGTLIDCIGPDGKHLQLSQTDCDNFNQAWGNVQKNDKNSNNNSSSTPSTYKYQTNTYPTNTYYPCTLHYAALNKYETYNYSYKTKEECDTAQKNLDNMLVFPTIIPQPTPTFDTEAHNSQVQHCRNEVNATYNDYMLGCRQRFGGTSAEEMCTQAYAGHRQRDYDACGVLL